MNEIVLNDRIRKLIRTEAISRYVCNFADDEFPENPITMLYDGTLEKDGKKIVLWEEVELSDPQTIAENIENDIDSLESLVRRILEIYLSEEKTLK